MMTGSAAELVAELRAQHEKSVSLLARAADTIEDLTLEADILWKQNERLNRLHKQVIQWQIDNCGRKPDDACNP